jgi:protocadherin Fat 1/2/3
VNISFDTCNIGTILRFLDLYTGVLGPVDPARDIETLNEDQESEYVGDSECGTEYDEGGGSPSLLHHLHHNNLLDSGGSGGEQDFHFPSAGSYLRHPNTYLPRYNINSETETNGAQEDSEDDDDDDVEPYGFPSSRRHHRDDEDGSVITVLGERASLLGGCTSNSDLSANLCDLDDSECEGSELKKLNHRRNWVPTGITQTSV